jgi:hypothetical protein
MSWVLEGGQLHQHWHQTSTAFIAKHTAVLWAAFKSTKVSIKQVASQADVAQDWPCS